MNIALFGGSFDPIHSDHILIMDNLYKLKKFDEIWIIPSGKHPFKKKFSANVTDRINMINIAIKDKPFIKLQTIEIDNNKKSYTYNTIKKLKDNFPYNNFTLIIGTDNINMLHKWKNIDKLVTECKIIAVSRNNINWLNNENIEKYKIEIIKINIYNVSSTEIRNGIKQNNKNLDIINYINNNMLYVKDRLKANLNFHKKRYNHCINVGNMAYKLAKIHNVDPKQAKLAGILHDITKYWKVENHKNYIKKYCIEFINEPIPTLHSYSAYCYLKYDLLYNNEICQAIKKHTVADEQMSDLDKIIFIADKISKERKFNKIKKIRRECFINLESGFKLVLKNQINEIVKKYYKNQDIGSQIVLSYKKWIKEE